MAHTLLPNLMQGIQLVRAGRKAEALPYLRLAARTEAIPTEGWLWLAAATDDREEYRHCINQALLHQPDHPVALRMRGELDRQERWTWGSGTGYAAADGALARGRPSRGRRILRALTLLVLAGACLGGAAALAVSGIVQDAIRDWTGAADAVTLDFTVGQPPGYRFQVEAPDTWLPANEEDPAWRETRERLKAAYPVPADQVSVWDQLGASFSAAIRNPVYGQIAPPVRLVETDQTVLERDNVVAALTLEEIVPLPDTTDGTPATICDRMRLLEQQAQAGEVLRPRPGEETLESAVIERGSADDCAVMIERRATGLLPQQVTFPLTLSRAPDAMRSVVMAVPTGEERYAVWRLTLAESGANAYADAIQTIAETLRRVPVE